MADLNASPSSAAWALQLPAGVLPRMLGALRLTPHVETAFDASTDTLWLRGRSLDAAAAATLAAIPATKRYAWLADDRLRPQGSRLATDRWPSLTWQPLQAAWPVTLPVPHLAASVGAPAPSAAFSLVAATEPIESNALLTTVGTWANWAADAPAIRLTRLRFAACPDGRALVLGLPPPALPGRALIEVAGVVIPAGTAWTPALTPGIVRRWAGAPEGAVVFWDEQGVRLIGAELWVQASRAAARATSQAIGYAEATPPSA